MIYSGLLENLIYMKIFELGLVLLFLVTANNAAAQLGFRAGLNFSEQEDYVIGVTSPIVGLNLGLQYKIDLIKGVSIQPEVYFIQKGGKEGYSTPNRRVSGSIFINYIETALLLRTDLFGVGKNGNFYLGITPHYGYAFGGIYRFVDGRKTSYERLDFDTDGFERLDYGFGGEIGVEFDKITIGLRYNHGKPNIADDRSRTQIFNRGLLLGVNYYLK